MINLKKWMTKLCEQVTKLNAKTTDIIIFKEFILTNITIQGNNTYTNTNINISSAIPNGYKVIAGVCRATGSNYVTCYQCAASNSTAILQLRNMAPSEITVAPIIGLLCVKV